MKMSKDMKQSLQPMRIKALLKQFENEDEDSDKKNDDEDSEDENEVEDPILLLSSCSMKDGELSTAPSDRLHTTLEKHVHGVGVWNYPRSHSDCTPLKHQPLPGSMRPVPSTSHRNIFQTPQSKIPGEEVPKDRDQTPASIFSSWKDTLSTHTPVQSREIPDPPRWQMRRPLGESIQSEPQNKMNPEWKENLRPAPSTQYGKRISVNGKQYGILGSLGQGMSGEVYRVQDLTTTDLKAIKYVNLARMDKESAESCINEIRMLSKLQAPSVITMFDFEIKNKAIYVVMEMGDTDLSSFLKSVSAEKRRLPLTMILYYWTEMLTAVKHIHDNGVIHSDLKPANFLLVRGRLKLIDFGISSSLNGEMTSVVKNTTVGTLNYISPEALMDVGGAGGDSPSHNNRYKISYKSDVWSLGCILYSMVYGHTPFHNIRAQWAKINAITNPHPNISFSSMENIPSILIDVVKKCLQHDPKTRPSVEQLLQVQYISTARQASASPPNIPPTILLKIKQTLEEQEWRTFTEVMGSLGNH